MVVTWLEYYGRSETREGTWGITGSCGNVDVGHMEGDTNLREGAG